MRNHQKEAAIIFIDVKKAFDSVYRNTLFQILHAYGIPEKIVKAIQIMYVNTSAVVLTPEAETTNFNINTGVLNGDPLAPYLFIIVYALRTAIDDREGLTLTRCRSSRHASHLSDLSKVSKTKYMHINPSPNDSVHSSDGSQTEKVDDFKYVGSCTNSQHDIQCTKVHALDNVWRAPIFRLSKLKIFRPTVEPILIYGCDLWSLTQSVENALDGSYTRMLQKTQNMSWRHHMTNQELYGSLPWTVRQRHLRLAGHVMRHDEAANKVLLWKPDGPRRRGRPTTTLQNIIEKDTNLSGTNLIAAMKNRNLWKEIIMSPH